MIHDTAVATDSNEWLASLEAEKIANRNMSEIFFDPIVSTSIGPLFDALITAPTGIYRGQPFVVLSQTASSLEAFFDGLNTQYNRNDYFRLLYQVQKYDPPFSMGFDQPPLTFNVRYAVVPR
jgi:hypothetical protein